MGYNLADCLNAALDAAFHAGIRAAHDDECLPDDSPDDCRPDVGCADNPPGDDDPFAAAVDGLCNALDGYFVNDTAASRARLRLACRDVIFAPGR